ncbi:MAG: hypothetical protein EOO94_03535, partial [Pedobacter sp.]
MANTINVYVTSTIGNGLYGGYTYFMNGNRIYLPALNGSGQSAGLSNGLALSHEMGHFFGLGHTHGWGAAGSTTELVNGSNSTTAGDLIQDTPADPAIAAYMLCDQTGACTYPYTIPPNPCNPVSFPPFCDPNGSVYQPLGNNLMLYSYSISYNTLTLKQCERIYNTYLTYYTNLLNGGFDLVSRDHPDDAGYEPTPSNDWIWVYQSPDIWNCRNPNLCTVHQEPGYASSSTTDNYLRVKVKNIGCANSTPAVLHTYWTLAATGETWPSSWTTQDICGLAGGREISNADATYGKTIPALSPNQETIITFPWDPVNPTPYTCIPPLSNGDPNLNLCLLSRIVSTADPMHSELSGAIDHNVRYNNNIVTRNTRLVNLEGSRPGRSFSDGGNILIQNATADAAIFNIHIVNKVATDDYFDYGAVVVTLTNELWQSWMAGGQSGSGFMVLDYSLRQLALTGNDAVLENVSIDPETVNFATFEYHLTKTCTTASTHDFAVYQTEQNGTD